jgi:hypothetical protein
MELFNRILFVIMGLVMLGIGIVALGTDLQASAISFGAGLGCFLIILVRVWHD